MSNIKTRERSQAFIQDLYKEKEIHKEHRHLHVIHKLFLTSSFFGLGQLIKSNCFIHLFLYIVPLIALVHDIYIFAEHDKIRRVGAFIKKFDGVANSAVCPEEIAWENFAETHRETQAVIASLIYTLIISIFSAAAIWKLDPKSLNDPLFIGWGTLISISIIAVFIRGYLAISVSVTKK